MAAARRRIRAGAAMLLLLALAACVLEVPLRAAFVGGRFGFVLGPGAPRNFFRCLDRMVVSDAAGETVWEIERVHPQLDNCGAWLPLLYGHAPAGMRTLVPPQRLRMDSVYVLQGWTGDNVEGAFVLHRAGRWVSVENLDPHGGAASAVAEAAAAWQRERHRRAFENAQRPQNEIVEGPFEDRPLPAER